MQNFWDNLTWPVVGLAPMDGVTDVAFREIMVRYGSPDLLYTEFTSVDGIFAGAERLLRDLHYTERQRPIVAQLFGGDPSHFFAAATLCGFLGFEAVDINMGCPAKNVTKHGAGADLIRDPERAVAIILEAKRGVQAYADGIALEELGLPLPLIGTVQEWLWGHPYAVRERALLPVSIKTRIGYAQPEGAVWLSQLAVAQPALVTVHGRTLKQLYGGQADWEAIAEGARLLHSEGIRILGNGDVQDRAMALEKARDYGVDGVLIGRSAQGNPWAFGESPLPNTFESRVRLALEHAQLFEELLPGNHFLAMRKHLLDYIKGAPHAKELRTALMRVSTYNETEHLINQFITSTSHAS